MRGIAFLAWRYLALHRVKTVLLVLSITLMVHVPAGLRVLVAESADASRRGPTRRRSSWAARAARSN